MKLLKQLKLYFQEGTSDKVYEIDLCESGDGFLVNFRYGRRGAALKEGTKTIFPVTLTEAEKVFNALETEKRKKGYVAAGEAPIVTIGEATPARPAGDKRKRQIIKLLKAAAAGEEPEHWSLSRIIWRAGDLKISEAIPHIIKVADPSDLNNIYSTVWAIGRCGTPDALGFLLELEKNSTLPEYVRQLIFDVRLKFAEGKDKEILLTAITESLPRPFRTSIAAQDPVQFKKDLQEFLFELKTASNEYLVGIYRLTRNMVKLHAVFLEVLSAIPFEHNYFKYVRRIFKTAEMLQDYGTVGVVAKQIEKRNAGYRSTSYISEEDKKLEAFSSRTKEYLTRRIIRQLRKYGEVNDDSFVELATDLLLAFSDERDFTPPYFTSKFNYRYDSVARKHVSEEIRTWYDAYAKYQAFNYILYKNSPRYRFHKDLIECVTPFTPGDAAPTEREEAFPHLWNSAPDEIIGLLAHSKVNKVHDFALKVWRANASFERHIETQHIIFFLGSYSQNTAALGLELARKKYNPSEPDRVLLTAMLDSALEDARKQAELWVVPIRTTMLRDTAFVILLMKMRRVEAHSWLRGFLSTHTFDTTQAQVIIGGTIAFLLTTTTNTDEEIRYINQVADTLVLSFESHLKNISMDVVMDLFKHPSLHIQAFGGKILMKHSIRPEELPENFLKILLTSENPESRGIGISLLGRFPDQMLLKKKDVLVSFCLSPLPDVRNAVRPIIFRLARFYPDFGKELVNLFVPAFLIKESYDGLHDDLLSLLSNELSDSLSVIPKEKALMLLNSRYRTSQLIGSILLKKTIKDSELEIRDLVKLGNNPLQEVRVFAWDTFRKYPDKVKAAKSDAVKVTDTDWDDTRIFAFDFFRTSFTASDWNTDLLVMLCDSTREDVQDFGREMITRFFDESHGREYLLKLSQHPSTKVQLFTTAYLERYAAGNPDVLSTLELYFVTLLSQVNKGRVAKARIMDFLKKEAQRDEQTARLAARIFSRVSVSVAITERAECIEALRDITRRFPGIQTPLVIRKIPDYVRH